MKKFEGILWGLVFILVGGIFTLNAIGITNINIFFSGWWTLFLIVPSFIGLFKERNKTASVIFLVIGVLLLLSCQNILEFATVSKFILPSILVIIGLSLIFRNTISEAINKKIREFNTEGLEEYCATFSGQNVNFQGEEFKGANLSAVFGGVELNLKGSIIKEDKLIHASAIFGGIEIYIPQDVNVKVKSTPIFGGVENKNVTVVGENIPTIYIDAFCLFGGVEIK